jgi:hypothetical protein
LAAKTQESLVGENCTPSHLALGALDGISAEQEHRANMPQDVLVGLREELRQIFDLDHQTRKTLRHAGNPKRAA